MAIFETRGSCQIFDCTVPPVEISSLCFEIRLVGKVQRRTEGFGGGMNTQSPLTDSELRIKRICASTYRSIHFAEQHVLCPLLTYNFIGPVPMINGKRRRVDERKQRANEISVSLSLSLSLFGISLRLESPSNSTCCFTHIS